MPDSPGIFTSHKTRAYVLSPPAGELRGIAGQGDLVAMGFEQIAQQPTDGLFIVNDQDVAVVEQRWQAVSVTV